METKDALIMGTVRQFQRVAAKYACIEELPIPVGDDIRSQPDKPMPSRTWDAGDGCASPPWAASAA